MLMRFDPFRELDRLTQRTWDERRPSVMAMDAYREGDTFRVHLDVPGVDPGSIDLTVEKNVLTVKAERSWPRTDGQELVVAERPQGSFTRRSTPSPTRDAVPEREGAVLQGPGRRLPWGGRRPLVVGDKMS